MAEYTIIWDKIHIPEDHLCEEYAKLVEDELKYLLDEAGLAKLEDLWFHAVHIPDNKKAEIIVVGIKDGFIMYYNENLEELGNISHSPCRIQRTF